MAGMTFTAEQRVALAERLGLDPWKLTPEQLMAKATELRERAAERAFTDALDDALGIPPRIGSRS